MFAFYFDVFVELRKKRWVKKKKKNSKFVTDASKKKFTIWSWLLESSQQYFQKTPISK